MLQNPKKLKCANGTIFKCHFCQYNTTDQHFLGVHMRAMHPDPPQTKVDRKY